MSSIEEIFEVELIKAGESDAPAPEVYWMAGWGKWEKLNFHMLLAHNSKTNFLINTGLPIDLTIRNMEMEEFAGKKAHFRSFDGVRKLGKIGYEPKDIKNVSVTPIQDYTCGRLDEFKNAIIFIERRGWIEDIQVPLDPENKKRELFMPDRILEFLEMEAHHRLRLFDSTEPVELIPGIRAKWVGCHHRSSTAFIINTSRGHLVFTDSAFKERNLRDSRPIGIAENLHECFEAYRELPKLGEVIPAYDPDLEEGRIA